MKLSAYFVIMIYTAWALIGCTKIDDKTIEAVPAPIVQQSVEEPELKKNYVKKLSQIYGYWDIISFDDYKPDQLSHDGRIQAYVHFMDGQANFRLDCNNAGMPAKLTRWGVLKIASRSAHLVSNSMGCGDEKNAREVMFFKFFRSQPKVEIFSPTELHLKTDDHVLILQKQVTTPEDLNGLWQLSHVDGVNVWTNEVPRIDFLEFNSSPTTSGVRVFNGCNSGSARTKFIVNRIKISNYTSQLKTCETEFETISQHYGEVLYADGAYRIDGEHLLIDTQNKRYELIRLQAKPQRRPFVENGLLILPNPFTRKVEGGDEHFFLDAWGKWQFVDKSDPASSELGPDAAQRQKPFVKFNPQREMWGHDGEVFFHRQYSFDTDSITFSPDPKRCSEDCFDISVKIGLDKRFEQQRFMGRYSFKLDGNVLTLSNENEVVKLEPYVAPQPLPPLPKDQALCEIRDLRPDETFPDYQKASFPEFGFNVMGSNETLMWDHQGGQQGSVELADGQAVLFESKSGVKVLRKVSPYSTMAIFGEHGLYCQHWGKDAGRTWPNINVIEKAHISSGISIGVRSQIVEENNCVRIQTSGGDRYTPIFNAYWMAGYDDFGVFLKDNSGVKKRVGDSLVTHPAGSVFDFNAYVEKANKFIPACPAPYRIYVP